MKKLLTFLASSSMLTQASVGVVSCIPKTENPPQKEQLTEEKLKDYVSNLTLNYSGKTVIPEGTIISSELMGDFVQKIENPLSKIVTKLFFDDLNKKYNYEGYGFKITVQRPEVSMNLKFNEMYTFEVGIRYISPSQNSPTLNPYLPFNFKIIFEGQLVGQDYLQQMIDSYLWFYKDEKYHGGITGDLRHAKFIDWGSELYNINENLELVEQLTKIYGDEFDKSSFKELKISDVQLIKTEQTSQESNYHYAYIEMTISLVENPLISKTISFIDIIAYAN